MTRKNRRTSRKKRGRGPSPSLVVIILVVIAVAGGFLAISKYQEHNYRERQVEKTRRPLATERRQMPERKRKSAAPALESYTAAVIPFQYSEAPPKLFAKLKPGTVAIVIDDMGTSVSELDQLTDIRIPLTFAVIPQLPHATQVAELAHVRGYEVMVHLPMEPKGYPQRRLEENGLLMGLSDEEIGRRIRGYLNNVPHAVGANNHMGSRFTEDSAKMLPVLQVLKEKKLYFLDSKTTPLSVGYALAHELGIRAASRNVFLDNIQEEDAIKRQLAETSRIARKRGYAIAICHPRPITIEVLTRELPLLRSEGITFVKLSQVVE